MHVFRAIRVAAVHIQTKLGESPLWERNIGLSWLDIAKQRLLTFRLNSTLTVIDLQNAVSSIARGYNEELLAVTKTGFSWLNRRSGRLQEIVSVVDGEVVTMNDGAIDAAGRCWAGSAVRAGDWRGALYRLQGQEASTHLTALGMSNGIDWSPDGKVLYHVDSAAGTVMAWDYDVRVGELSRGSLLRKVASSVGLPDGLTVDGAGNIWLAVWGAGQVWCLSGSTGETLAVVQVPTRYTTSCTFGGRELSALYITTANHKDSVRGGLLYSVDVPVKGREPNRFAGPVPGAA